MYHPLTAFMYKEVWVEYYLWTKTFVTGGARGVALKSKFPLMATWAKRLGFLREDCSRLRVITTWGVRQSHS